MKALVICQSVSHGNTAKVAQAIAVFVRVGRTNGILRLPASSLPDSSNG
jgi:hypothetical protein